MTPAGMVDKSLVYFFSNMPSLKLLKEKSPYLQSYVLPFQHVQASTMDKPTSKEALKWYKAANESPTRAHIDNVISIIMILEDTLIKKLEFYKLNPDIQVDTFLNPLFHAKVVSVLRVLAYFHLKSHPELHEQFRLIINKQLSMVDRVMQHRENLDVHASLWPVFLETFRSLLTILQTKHIEKSDDPVQASYIQCRLMLIMNWMNFESGSLPIYSATLNYLSKLTVPGQEDEVYAGVFKLTLPVFTQYLERLYQTLLADNEFTSSMPVNHYSGVLDNLIIPLTHFLAHVQQSHDKQSLDKQSHDKSSSGQKSASITDLSSALHWLKQQVLPEGESSKTESDKVEEENITKHHNFKALVEKIKQFAEVINQTQQKSAAEWFNEFRTEAVEETKAIRKPTRAKTEDSENPTQKAAQKEQPSTRKADSQHHQDLKREQFEADFIIAVQRYQQELPGVTELQSSDELITRLQETEPSTSTIKSHRLWALNSIAQHLLNDKKFTTQASAIGAAYKSVNTFLENLDNALAEPAPVITTFSEAKQWLNTHGLSGLQIALLSFITRQADAKQLQQFQHRIELTEALFNEALNAGRDMLNEARQKANAPIPGFLTVEEIINQIAECRKELNVLQHYQKMLSDPLRVSELLNKRKEALEIAQLYGKNSFHRTNQSRPGQKNQTMEQIKQASIDISAYQKDKPAIVSTEQLTASFDELYAAMRAFGRR